MYQDCRDLTGFYSVLDVFKTAFFGGRTYIQNAGSIPTKYCVDRALPPGVPPGNHSILSLPLTPYFHSPILVVIRTEAILTQPMGYAATYL